MPLKASGQQQQDVAMAVRRHQQAAACVVLGDAPCRAVRPAGRGYAASVCLG